MRDDRTLGAALRLLAVAAPFCSVAPGTGLAAAAGAPPAAAFGTLPRTSFVELSPDGKFIAWCDQGPTPQRIVVFDRAAGKLLRPFALPEETKLRAIAWAGDETLLFSVSVTRPDSEQQKQEFFRTFTLDLASGRARLLLMQDQRQLVTGADLVAWRVTKPNTVIMSTLDYANTAARESIGTHIWNDREDSGWVSMLFEVDTRTGHGTRIEMGDPFTEDWVVNGDGAAVARSEWYPNKSLFRILAKHGLAWDEIYRADRETALEGLTADGKSIVTIESGKDGHAKLLARPLDGSGPKVLLEDPNLDVTGVIADRFDGAPAGVELSGIQPQIRWLDPAIEGHVKALQASFPGREVALYSPDRDRMQWIARVSGPSAPPVFYLIDYASHRADIVGEEYPDLTGVKLGAVRAFTYRARDGAEIPAYLTTPPDAGGQPLPLVVMPHGGPRARDDYDFDWWAQFLATRGYAVLQPQFRGSTGFGQAFADAGVRQWGRLMQDDVTDGVKALIDQRIADPHRICIVGASYGGYAALAGVAFTPDLYACAVSVNGVSDLLSMQAYEAQHNGSDSNAVAYWRTEIGSAFDGKVAEKSPDRAAAQVRVPVLLIQSTDDTVVPFAQSKMMWSALHEAGKNATLLTLPGDDHWLSRSETRLAVLQAIEAFLERNL